MISPNGFVRQDLEYEVDCCCCVLLKLHHITYIDLVNIIFGVYWDYT